MGFSQNQHENRLNISGPGLIKPRSFSGAHIMCGFVFVADWHATTANRCSRIDNEDFVELTIQLRVTSAARG